MFARVQGLQEYLGVLTREGEHTGIFKPHSLVHRDGDYHRAEHVWIYAESTGDRTELGKLLYAYYHINKSPWPYLDENKAFMKTADSCIDYFHNGNGSPLNMKSSNRLQIVPYSTEYLSSLSQASELLSVASWLVDTPSLKRLLDSKAKKFLSNDYFESYVAWIELDSRIDLTIGPYETYEGGLFGYKSMFEAFIGIPIASPICVMHLIFNAGDVKGPQTITFKLPNDERVIEKHGNVMVLKMNVSYAKFYEIRPHKISELQELHSSIEEAKADIVGLWELHYMIHKHLLPKNLETTMYVSFLVGCFCSIHFRLNELMERVKCYNGTFMVDFSKVGEVAESLSREILMIQAMGINWLLDKYSKIIPSMGNTLNCLHEIQVPLDIYILHSRN
ncbi:hypothetical protein KP509_04G064500 [Ceratopteris richardii]|uniref:Uncharacterized protein n=1 Tax=Ceratopteris richardii TaxID=49495 RepID=A0A8T2V0I8_CERRI|nr:hypothetical protein KP509_04G064500 [Ceratopteris richardii]